MIYLLELVDLEIKKMLLMQQSMQKKVGQKLLELLVIKVAN